MLQNTLSIIEMTMEKQLKNNATSDILRFFERYKTNMWIYPGVLKRQFSLELSDVYAFLFELEQQDILQSYYELYCGHCQKSMGTVAFFNELPDFFECELCHEELSGLENCILIYKVIKDD